MMFTQRSRVFSPTRTRAQCTSTEISTINTTFAIPES